MAQQLHGAALEHYLRAGATRRNVDPDAVMQVVGQEGGLYGAVGDNGTSFGPFQLHWHGAMPAQYVGNYEASVEFANSPAGLDYALDRIASVAAGLHGGQAVSAIVSRFERPADPGAEIRRATGSEPVRPGRPDTGAAQGGGSSTVSQIEGALGLKGGLAATWLSALNPISGVTDFLKAALWLVDPTNWLRLVELVAGAVLMLLGLLGLAVMFVQRSGAVGEAAELAQQLPGPAGAAGRAVSTVRETRSPFGRRTAAYRLIPQRVHERAEQERGRRQAQERARSKRLTQARERGRRQAERVDELAKRRRAGQAEANRFGEVPF